MQLFCLNRAALLFIALAFIIPAPTIAKEYTLQTGIALSGAIQQSLDSRSATAGTPVTIVLTPPYPNALLNGAKVYGHVASVQKAGQGTQPHIALAFDRIEFRNGKAQPLHAQLLKDTPVQDASGKQTVAVARAVGGIVGPAHGLGIGLLSKNHKDDITIPQNSTIVMELTQPLRI